MIKVSVIIPAYNVEKHIESCLKSIINQTLKGIEIIVVNDGSTDDTEKVINLYKNIDKRIQIITTKNNGVSSARNIGLLRAKGKYIFQIDGDDWLESDGLEKLYKLGEQKNADIIISNAYRNNKGKLTSIIDGQHLSDDLLKDFFLRIIKPSVCTKLYKKDLFLKNNINFLNGVRIGEDLLINFYLIFYAKKVVKIEESFLHYIKREDSIMNSYQDEIKDLFIVFNNIKDFLIEKNLFTKYKSEYMYLKYYHTFYLRVVKSSSLDPVHKMFYDRFKNEKTEYVNNEYISKFLKDRSITSRIIEYIYEKNYYFGFLLRKLIINIKYGKTIIQKLKKR